MSDATELAKLVVRACAEYESKTKIRDDILDAFPLACKILGLEGAEIIMYCDAMYARHQKRQSECEHTN